MIIDLCIKSRFFHKKDWTNRWTAS